MASDTDTAKSDALQSTGGTQDAAESSVFSRFRRKSGVDHRQTLGAIGPHGRRVPALARRIVLINVLGLLALGVGVFSFNRLSETVLSAQSELLSRQASTLATLIAEVADVTPAQAVESEALREAGPDPEQTANLRYSMNEANEILLTIAVPSGVRIQLYDNKGRLTGDTRTLLADEPLDETVLPRPGAPEGLFGAFESVYRTATELFNAPLPAYSETAADFIAGPDDIWVWDALRGETPEVVFSRNSANELIMTATAPVRRVQGVMGALVVSTQGDAVDRVIAGGRTEIFRIFLIGAPVFVLLAVLSAMTIARPIRRLAKAADARETRGGAVGMARVRIPDLTDRHDEIGDLSASLRDMTDALYARIDAIETFAADVSHEIKNPLTSLRSAVETMRLARTDNSRERLLQIIEHDVARMDRLVTDISNASRLDAELVREEQQTFDFTILARTVADISAPTMGEGDRGVRVQVEAPDALPAVGMESRLAQVLHNFIDNAISFSPSGGLVTLRASAAGGWLTAEVTDQGPGVPPDSLQTVFERFYTTERPDSDAFGEHSGLGLSISRQIVEAHGGSVWAENLTGVDADEDADPIGAKFAFRIPL